MKARILFSVCLLLMFSGLYAQQNALDFDNVDDNVSVANASALLAGSNSLSMTLWVKPNNPTGAWPDYDGFAGFRNDANADFYLVQLGPSGVEARLRTSSGTAYTANTSTLQTGVWQHFALTYDGSTLKLYRNAVEVASIPASGTITNQTVNFLMGNLVYSVTNFYLLGQLDEVSLWTKALTPEEILHIYSCAINPTAPNLVLYYKFDQGVAGGNNAGILSLNPSTGALSGTLNNFGLSGGSSNFVNGVGNAINTITASICQGQSYQFGPQTLTNAGVYTQTFTTAGGCDSVVQLSLTVNQVLTTITQTGITLTAALSAATYKWVNCNTNYSLIAGATGQSFTPTANGSYACIITYNGCSDTSICKTITTVGIPEEEQEISAVYPNPAGDNLTLEFNTLLSKGKLELCNLTGEVIVSEDLSGAQTKTMDISRLPKGVYFIRFSNSKKTLVRKVIKA